MIVHIDGMHFPNVSGAPPTTFGPQSAFATRFATSKKSLRHLKYKVGAITPTRPKNVHAQAGERPPGAGEFRQEQASGREGAGLCGQVRDRQRRVVRHGERLRVTDRGQRTQARAQVLLQGASQVEGRPEPVEPKVKLRARP